MHRQHWAAPLSAGKSLAAVISHSDSSRPDGEAQQTPTCTAVSPTTGASTGSSSSSASTGGRSGSRQDAALVSVSHPSRERQPGRVHPQAEPQHPSSTLPALAAAQRSGTAVASGHGQLAPPGLLSFLSLIGSVPLDLPSLPSGKEDVGRRQGGGGGGRKDGGVGGSAEEWEEAAYPFVQNK